MVSELEDDTVVRPRPLVAPSLEDLDADTIIRARTPFADVPAEALELIAEPAELIAEPSEELVEPAAKGTGAHDAAPETLDYAFRINAAVVALDSAAIVGRRPSLPRITSATLPRLITVPSPLREVSSSHLELRQQGALVVLTDLHSTNGSFVRTPGRPPAKLQQGETLVVVPGTTIDIGDDNIIEILPLQRADAGRTIDGERP